MLRISSQELADYCCSTHTYLHVLIGFVWRTERIRFEISIALIRYDFNMSNDYVFDIYKLYIYTHRYIYIQNLTNLY